jgi:hypothetical protein
MHNLGLYYQEQKDYNNMIKYYLLAIENGCHISMYNLANYFKKQYDYDNMLKYYLMVISSNGCTDSMNNLANFYKEQEDYENMLKYYLMTGPHCDKNLLKYVVDYCIKLQDYNNIMNFLWIGLDSADYMIIEKVSRYLLKHKYNMENIMEIYFLCCNDIRYENYLQDLKNIINIQQIQYEKYSYKRHIKLYKLINKHIHCDHINFLICEY